VDSNKGDFGRVLLVGGSRGMAGSISLSGMAALRSGAGLVRLAVPDCVQATVASFQPAYMTVGLPSDAGGKLAPAAFAQIEVLANEATVLAIGPGLGQSESVTAGVGQLYRSLRIPLVIDADGLNALSKQREILAQPGGPRVMTPHPGEFARLLGVEKIASGEREAAAQQFARETGVVLVCKGHRTIISDGAQTVRNETGNPGMATGGTGDVLTGIIAALLGQKLTPFAAAQLGCHLHGAAGDLAAGDLGQVSLIASDLLDYLPRAFLGLSGG
jgi:NAD(P)H-hydrate epimerase